MNQDQRAKNERIELELFGSDLKARTDDDLNTACLEWLHKTEWEPMHIYTGIDCWNFRHGTKWQAELEEFVEQWRKEP